MRSCGHDASRGGEEQGLPKTKKGDRDEVDERTCDTEMTGEILSSRWNNSIVWLCASHHELLLTIERQQCCTVVVSQAK